jgi:endoglucanase
MDIFAYLEGMAVQHGPSGHEGPVSQWMAEWFRPLVDSVEIDPLYNVIACKKATLPTPDGSPAPKVLLCAHQDEIALMVSDILKDGTLRMGQVGGVDPRILPAGVVKVHASLSGETLTGVVGATPPHLLSAADRQSNYKREDLFVDLGLCAEAVREKVAIGDLITLCGPATKLLNERCAAKTMDDRACVGVLLEAAERLRRMQHMCDIYFVATSQEEVGSKGAAVAAYTVDPDLAVVLDVSHATIPASRPDTTVPLDAPAVTYGPFIQHKLLERMKKTARENGIKINTQLASSRTYTDTDNIQIARAGVPCVLIDLPLKYMHTTVELLDADVITECGRLLALFLAGIDEKWEDGLWN